MPSPNSTFTELVSTTLRNHPTEVTDNVSTHNAFYRRLKDKNQIKKFSGGYELAKVLDYAENGTYQRFAGWDTLNISTSNVISAAKYDTVNAVIHVASSGDELRKNAGKEQLINLAKAKIKNAMRTAANNMSTDLYSSGSLTNQMGGLGHIIQTNGQGTVGGIDSGTYTFWRNQFREMSGTSTWTKSTIKGDMNAIWLTLVRGTDKPDLILSTHDFYAAYWESLQDLTRYNDPSADSKAVAGFSSLKFATADVVFDSNSNFATTGEKQYFLNTDYLTLEVHRDFDWAMQDDKIPLNQDGVIIPIIWSGQATCTNRSLQGILLDAS